MLHIDKYNSAIDIRYMVIVLLCNDCLNGIFGLIHIISWN